MLSTNLNPFDRDLLDLGEVLDVARDERDILEERRGRNHRVGEFHAVLTTAGSRKLCHTCVHGKQGHRPKEPLDPLNVLFGEFRERENLGLDKRRDKERLMRCPPRVELARDRPDLLRGSK